MDECPNRFRCCMPLLAAPGAALGIDDGGTPSNGEAEEWWVVELRR
jgi:hypothetical protein